MHRPKTGRTGDAGVPTPVAGPAFQTSHGGHHGPRLLYSLALLQAARRGAGKDHAVLVLVTIKGRMVEGLVIGIGSRLGVIDADGRLHEDINPECVTWVGIVRRGSS